MDPTSTATDHSSRIFLAVWPDAGLADRLHDIGRRHLPAGQGRLLDAGKLHLTLAFLGTVGQAQRHCLESGVETHRPPVFSLTIDCLGYWPHSRILWAGCSQTPDILRQWVGHLRVLVAGCGLAAEIRSFRTHVTLARNVRRYHGIGRGGRVAARIRKERVDGISPLDWPVKHLTLVSSETRQHGTRYTILREWPFS